MFGQFNDLLVCSLAFHRPRKDTPLFDGRFIAAKAASSALQFRPASPVSSGLNSRQQICIALGTIRQGQQRRFNGCVITLRAHFLKACDLTARTVSGQSRAPPAFFFVHWEQIDANDAVFSAMRCFRGCGLCATWECPSRWRWPFHLLFDLVHQRQCLCGHLVGKVLHHAGAVPDQWPPSRRLPLKEQLGIAYPCRRLRGQSDGFVHGIGVQRLRATKGRCDGFNAVRATLFHGSCAVRTIRLFACGSGASWIWDVWRPAPSSSRQTGRAHFGDFLEMVHPARPEKT